MNVSISFDPHDPADIRRASDFFQATFLAVPDVENTLRQAVSELRDLASGELLTAAYENFGTNIFTLAELSEATGRPVPSLHSQAANLGRACAQRNIEVFDRHGGQPTGLSVRQEVARVLRQL